nr:MAG TPA: hypothetical protein [Caudoviricetes sp.]
MSMVTFIKRPPFVAQEVTRYLEDVKQKYV